MNLDERIKTWRERLKRRHVYPRDFAALDTLLRDVQAHLRQSK